MLFPKYYLYNDIKQKTENINKNSLILQERKASVRCSFHFSISDVAVCFLIKSTQIKAYMVFIRLELRTY